jgi:hypothetical protein
MIGGFFPLTRNIGTKPSLEHRKSLRRQKKRVRTMRKAGRSR